MAEPILTMEHITKRFDANIAVNDVTFQLDRGEIHALVGENGAGKSTLMKILSGSYAHDTYAGKIVLDGKTQLFRTPADAEKNGVAMIYQEISMHPDMSVAENTLLGKWNRKGPFIDDRQVVESAGKYLAMMGLELDPATPMRYLSTSQQQMVAIARALSRAPKVLILDEPTSSLTDKECQVLHRNILRLKEQGISCIYITHRLNEVLEVCDRVTVLRDGKVISVRNIERTPELADRIIEDMIGRSIDHTREARPAFGDDVQTMLRVEHLCVMHGQVEGKKCVDDVSFEVKKGEIVGLAGLVGSGRSETVNAVFGYMKRQAGKIFIEGREISVKKPADAIRHGLGLLTEDRRASGFVSAFSLKNNITLASLGAFSDRLGFLKEKRERSSAQRYFDKMRIKAAGIDESIQSLSGGNQQKVVLAKWLLKGPKALILDDPTRGIDVGSKQQIYEIIQELARGGMAIVVISSEFSELSKLCDRMYVLVDGRVRAHLKNEELTEEEFMRIATGL